MSNFTFFNRYIISCFAFRKKLLHMKYRQNPRHKQVLLSTRGKRLVEFSRMAQSIEEKGGKKEKWGGYVDENGKLWVSKKKKNRKIYFTNI